MFKKNYAIFLNGEYPIEEDSFHRDVIGRVDCAVAVDGGRALFERLELTPDIIVADFDSSPPVEHGLAEEVVALNPEKDKTDGESALELALERGAEEIALCGFCGGPASDQILGNLLLLQRAADFRPPVKVYCLSAFQRVWFVRDRGIELDGQVGETISVVPLDEQIKLSAIGLRYPASDLSIKRGSTIGLSNTLIERAGSLTISGAALVFQRRNSNLTLTRKNLC